MKKILFIAFYLIFALNHIHAQMPNTFRYQAVIRNSNGEVVDDKPIKLKMSILQNSATGTNVYSEVFEYTTNEYGLVAVNIGAGEATFGVFNSIDWGASSYYLQVEVDIDGGSNYKLMGASQILAVPYALYALDVKNNDDADADPDNEIQVISKNKNTVSLSKAGGSFIDEVNDADADPTNEIQNLAIANNVLRITNNPNATPISIDADPANEIQDLSLVDNVLRITNNPNATGITIDASPTNEIQNLILDDNILKITNNPNATPISLAAYQGNNTDEQTLSYSIIDNELSITIEGGTGGNSTISFELPNDFVSAENGGTFDGSIFADNLSGINTGDMSNNQIVNAYNSTYPYIMTENDRNDLNYLILNNKFQVSGGEVNLIVTGITTVTLPLSGGVLANELYVSTYVANNTLTNNLGSGRILIGNTLNKATEVPIGGDASISVVGSIGNLTISKIGGKNIALGGSFATTGTANITINPNPLGSVVTLPYDGILANEDFVDDQILTNNSNFTGNDKISTLGTIIDGTWNGDDIEPEWIDWSRPEWIGSMTPAAGTFTTLTAITGNFTNLNAGGYAIGIGGAITTAAAITFSGSNAVRFNTSTGTTNLTLPAVTGTLATTDNISNFTGNDKITTVGTIGTGVWNAGAINTIYAVTASTGNFTNLNIANNAISPGGPLTTGGAVTFLGANDISFTTLTGTTSLTLPAVTGTLATTDNISNFTGNDKITTLGTIGTGVWNAGAINTIYAVTASTGNFTNLNVANNAISPGGPLTTGGAVTFSGANDISFTTLTGTTSLTLPAVTGTLATTDDILSFTGSNNITTLGTIGGNAIWNAGAVTSTGEITGKSGVFETIDISKIIKLSISAVLPPEIEGTIYYGENDLVPGENHLYLYNGSGWFQLDK